MGGSGLPVAADSVGSYPVKTSAVAGFNGAGMTSAQVMDILRRLDPAAVTDAGTAHTQLGTVLDQVAGRLTQHANVLADSWSGSAAQAAMGKFQQLHDQMTLLSQQATQVGSVLTWLGTQVLPWAKALPDPAAGNVSISGDVTKGAKTGAEIGLSAGGAGLIAGAAVGGVAGAVTGVASALFGGGHQAADVQARQYISTLSEYLVQANDNLPGTIGVPAAGSGQGAGNSGSGSRSAAGANEATGLGAGALDGAGGPGSGQRGGGAAAGGTAAGGRGTATGGQHGGVGPGPASGGAGSSLDGSGVRGFPASSGTVPASAGPGSVRVPVPVSSLQGVPSPVGPGVPSAALPGSPAVGVTGMDGVGSAAGTGMAGAAPLLPGTSPIPGASLVPGTSLLPGTSLVSGSPVPPDPAVPGLPEAPGASASASSSASAGGQARTQDGGQVATGFPMGGAGGAAAERERRRYAWMYEDEDVWGADGTDCVPPVIYGHDWRGPRA
jgi:uncharacterized protein YukE